MLSGMNLDMRLVSQELEHKLRRKFKTDAEIIAAVDNPQNMQWEWALEKAKIWEKWSEANGKQMNAFTDVFCDVRTFFATARDRLKANLANAPERRQRIGRKPTVKEAVEAFQTPDASDDQGNVVQLGKYRRDTAPAYRPKF